MPTPTEKQRTLHVRKSKAAPVGLDAWYYGLLGRIRRGPWAIKRIETMAQRMEVLREEFNQLNNGQLDDRLQRMREHRRRYPQSPQLKMEEGLALLAVTAKRELGLSPYKVQLMAAAALIEGFLTEVDTGEGKTLALALAAAYIAWSGLPCHVITANDYLAGRDSEYLKRFYQRVGLKVDCVLGDTFETDRRVAYQADITYTTAKEVAADYLRDRLRLQGVEDIGSRLSLSTLTTSKQHAGAGVIQRGLYNALIDEADNSLIDEAVTPLIISRILEAGELELACESTWKVAATLEEGVDYRVERASKRIEVEEDRILTAAARIDLPQSGLWASARRRVELLILALEAQEFFLRDVQYVVDDSKVVIVDEATGRPMPMRTWRQGLHQMIEAKEGVPISGASETMARISFQSFFRKYERIAGASGTVREVASEIWQTYGIPTMAIPRHKPCRRQFLGRIFYSNQEEKVRAVKDEIRMRHEKRQPVLVGTRSVEASEIIMGSLESERLACCILNAKKHKEEAALVSLAGQLSGITIATNMAGRGTDIHLESGADILGGLHVVASEPHESSRVDRQLFGRAGRQGDPGSVIALYSLDDELFIRFLPEPIRRFWAKILLSDRYKNLGQAAGKYALYWAQYRAQALARRRRKQVIDMEQNLVGSLGFTKGINRPKADLKVENG